MEQLMQVETANWFQSTARQRIAGLLDEGSFTEYIGPAERVQSPTSGLVRPALGL